MGAKKNKEEDIIHAFCERVGISYAPVSELNTASTVSSYNSSFTGLGSHWTHRRNITFQAFCSFFWGAEGDWIVVTFKGTGIQEYADWVTDLTVTMVDSDDFIKSDSGRAKAVKGFKERLYSPDVSDLGGTRAWDTIRFALCNVSKKLAERRAAQGKYGNINVWFTGHSRMSPSSVPFTPSHSFNCVFQLDRLSLAWLILAY